MAFVDQIWVSDSKDAKPMMRVYVKLQPSGSVTVYVPIPQDFMRSILGLAQTAADHHEAQMRAQILADETTQQPKDAK